MRVTFWVLVAYALGLLQGELHGHQTEERLCRHTIQRHFAKSAADAQALIDVEVRLDME